MGIKEGHTDFTPHIGLPGPGLKVLFGDTFDAALGEPKGGGPGRRRGKNEGLGGLKPPPQYPGGLPGVFGRPKPLKIDLSTALNTRPQPKAKPKRTGPVV